MGAFGGCVTNTVFTNCVVKDTCLTGQLFPFPVLIKISSRNVFFGRNGNTGGFIGNGTNISLNGCLQSGINSTAYFVTSLAYSASVGGFAGCCLNCSFFQCGVTQGVVQSATMGPSYAGGFIGAYGAPLYISQSYISAQVCVIATSHNGGFGGIKKLKIPYNRDF